MKKTKINKTIVLHYTCNPPSEEILKKYNIKLVGKKYGLSEREILEIPLSLYKKYGFEIGGDLTLITEQLLKRLR